jgi:hypothetical protein
VPSSILFAALSAAWLAFLVPMFARRRQEVSRTTDAALAARVVRRGTAGTPAFSGAPRADAIGETPEMLDLDAHDVDPDFDDEYRNDEQWRPVHGDDVRAGRRYRPGRGGFDPEAAALAARAKYARRQRIVLLMLVAAVASGLVAGFVLPIVWWGHGFVDVVLVGYLTYLRRQVRIEEDVRRRRLARLSAAPDVEPPERDAYDEDEPDLMREPDLHRPAPAATVHNAVVVEIDDEDPMFDELDERLWEPYRRAVGE